jgi:hypothetical protein
MQHLPCNGCLEYAVTTLVEYHTVEYQASDILLDAVWGVGKLHGIVPIQVSIDEPTPNQQQNAHKQNLLHA